jgi:hypothetical protein
MREPAADAPIFGLMAEFDTIASLLDSLREARKAGYTSLETYSPFPINGLEGELGFSENLVPLITLTAGIVGLCAIMGLQYYANWRYPIEIGGRPLYTWQAFLVIAFEVTLLTAGLGAFLSMLILNRLPRLHYPLFDKPNFHFVSADKLFLVIFSNDEKFDRIRTRRFLEKRRPLRVDLVGPTEEAE